MTKKRTSPSHGAARRRSRVRRTSPWLALALLASGVLIAVLGLAVAYLLLPGPLQEHSVVTFVAQGTSAERLSEQLAKEGVVRQPWLFRLYLGATGQFDRVAPGPHLLKPGLDPLTLARCLTRSPRRPKVQVTIPEGFDQYRVANRLQSLGVCNASDFLAASSASNVLAELSIDGPSAEGYLFPLTYTLPIDSDPKQLLSAWVGETRRRLEAISEDHQHGLARLREQRGWGEHEILTLASIIEKESHRDDERRTIASVFFNRLDDADFRPRRMLQSDPTAYYGCMASSNRYAGCEGNPGRVVPAMLRDAQNPYNTYRHAGLPPGPIANPSASSIAAVMDPDRTDYLFFVAKSGKHVFSRTLAEHQATTRGDE